MVNSGVTTKLPPYIVYELAPDGWIVNVCPLQIVPVLAVIKGRVFALTVMVTAVRVGFILSPHRLAPA